MRYNLLMLADRPVPDDWVDRLGKLAERWSRDGSIAALYLFGSRARGNPSARSDVDLALAMRDGLTAAERWRERLRLLGEAQRELATEAIDLVVLEESPALLGHRVLAGGRLLLERDAVRRTALVEKILRHYIDEAPIRALFDRAVHQRICEGRFAR